MLIVHADVFAWMHIAIMFCISGSLETYPKYIGRISLFIILDDVIVSTFRNNDYVLEYIKRFALLSIVS